MSWTCATSPAGSLLANYSWRLPEFLRPAPNPAAGPFVGEDEGSGRWGGEVESWEQTLAGLASQHGPALKRHAFLLCGHEAEADDLVQEALVRAFTRPPRVPRPEAAEAYVRAIMVNLFIDGARRRSRWSRVAPLLRPAGMTPDPADQVSDRDAMLTALRSLSPRQRACVVLRYYQDLPVAEVAAVLGVGEGTVKRYLSEAMSRVAVRLSSAESG
jgi:RNA polymerase sigma-70 factor (sigma-E family)